ncbi:hypothetical protein [Paenibacillus polymyxa]|uniref:hypothetical protein n=1 Tax=Paenibacillus polymyxa TaxID=1406 RepID=UPI00321640F7
MSRWNEEKVLKQSDIDQVTGVIHKILHETIDQLGIAYGIVSEFSYNSEEPPSWTISIDDSKTVLKSSLLFHYLKQHGNLNDALTQFMRDHFSYFV